MSATPYNIDNKKVWVSFFRLHSVDKLFCPFFLPYTLFPTQIFWKQCSSFSEFCPSFSWRIFSESNIASTFSLYLYFQFLVMAALTSLSFSATSQCSQRKSTLSSTRFLASSSDMFGIRTDSSYHCVGVRVGNSASKMVIQCMSSVTGLCFC